MQIPKKILILRFSSIGDIVLTTPVIRSLRKCFPDATIHYFTKRAYVPLLEHNPYLDQVYGFKEEVTDYLPFMRRTGYDFVVDLHNNLRSRRVKMALRRPSAAFPKLNFQKYLLTRFKLGRMPDVHIVQRYAEAMKPLECDLDDEGLDFFSDAQTDADAKQELAALFATAPAAIVIGAKFGTKQWPTEYFPELINRLNQPVVLIGGPEDREKAGWISERLHVPHLNAAENGSLLQNAARLKHCSWVLTHDTGFMHIAAAFKKKIFVLWGNTIPGFGMYPYKTEHYNLEVNGLNCRPCSKIGYEKCPKGHFKCMREQSPEKIAAFIQNTTAKNSDI